MYLNATRGPINPGHSGGSRATISSRAWVRSIVLWLAVVLSLLLVLGNAQAACDTNPTTVVDLGSWSVIQYGPFTQGPASWSLSQSNTVALQSSNADASILLSPFVLQNDQIQGSWRVDTAFDDDFIGFVFGYQDDRHFYLFDWKQADQTLAPWGFSQRGMSVKVISAGTPLTVTNLGSTFAAETNQVRLLYHNTIPWDDFTDYQFNLEFFAGHFAITVTRGATILTTISIDDNTYTDGRFGFYNFSQDSVRYSGFTRRALPPRPFISVQDSSVIEGDLGTTDLVFSVNLSFTNCDPTIVDYFITPGSATAGEDYATVASGTLVLAPGETNKMITVTVFGDRLNEPNETVLITLSNAINGTISAGQGVGTIIDDDPYPTLQIDDVSVPEGNSGTTPAVFTLTLSAPSGQTISVGYFTANVTAVAGSDYDAVPVSVLTFLPGQTAASIPVTIRGDKVVERDETFSLCLTNPVNVTVAEICGIGTIVNDDTNQLPTVSIIHPFEGAVFSALPGLVPIEADARDSDGFVQRVDFFAEAISIGAAANAPWIVPWTNNVPGMYSLTAIATDNDGGKGTSAPVHIIIRPCNPTLIATPLTNQIRCVCDAVVFSTSVSNAEPLSIVWRANGIVLPGETNSALVLQDLKPTQAGMYTVELSTPCATISRSAILTLKGAGNQNPVSFTNASRITIFDNANASPYPSSLEVACVPGPVKHLSVTLDGLYHNFPDDIDMLLVSPAGPAVKLMSDTGGSQNLTNVILTFTDTATQSLPDTTPIVSGTYQPTDYEGDSPFPPPAPGTITATNLVPFLGTDPNGTWRLFIVDDHDGDGGFIARGWYVTLEWEDMPPLLTSPVMHADGRFEMTLYGLPRMTHVIESSADLLTWIPVRTNTITGPAVIILDPLSSGEGHRFFRAVRCP